MLITPTNLEIQLQSALDLAAYFQDDYSLKLPVISAFRQWRGGHLSNEAFLSRLSSDDFARVLGYEKNPPMEGLALLRRYRDSYPRR